MTNKHLLNTETKREMTYHEWLDIWLEVYNLPLYAHSTYLSRMYSTRTLKANIEDKNLSMYSNIELQMLINKLFDKGYSKATLIKMNTIIKRSFMQAKKDKFIEELIGQDIIIPTNAPIKKVEALTRSEQKQVEKAAINCAGGDVIIFLLYSGLRRSELINLLWTDYDTNTGHLKIRKSKTEAGVRVILLPLKAREVINKRPRCSKWIFTSQANKQLNYTSIKRIYMRIREKTGLYSFTTHVCRHTFATRLSEEGANPKAVADLLGHKKVDYALKIYTDLDKLKTIKEVKRLDHLNL